MFHVEHLVYIMRFNYCLGNQRFGIIDRCLSRYIGKHLFFVLLLYILFGLRKLIKC